MLNVNYFIYMKYKIMQYALTINCYLVYVVLELIIQLQKYHK